MGLAIYNSVILDVTFPQVLYKCAAPTTVAVGFRCCRLPRGGAAPGIKDDDAQELQLGATSHSAWEDFNNEPKHVRMETLCRRLPGEALAVEDLRELRPTVCENLVKLARKSFLELTVALSSAGSCWGRHWRWRTCRSCTRRCTATS